VSGVFTNTVVRDAIARAWRDSQAGTSAAHEEGGFVLRHPDGSLLVERWPRGTQDEIILPPYSGGCRGTMPIIATFHTHPNIDPGYQQEPSTTDVEAVRDDPDLNHPDYEGEYVIATLHTYRIRKNGQVETVGETNALLNLP
jgi:hypothetical protein